MKLKAIGLIAIFLLVLAPVNSWALAKIKYDIDGDYSLIHGNTYVGGLTGTLYGYWDDVVGKFSGVKGWLKGDYGRVDFVGGYLNFDGSGSLYGLVTKYGYYGTKDYIGGFHFKDKGWFYGPYDNEVNADYLNIWGGGYFLKFFTPYYGDHSYFKGIKWLGADLYGKGTKIPEPATMGLLALGLIGLIYTRRRKTGLV